MSPAQLIPTQRAAVLYGPKDLRLEDRPVWPPQYNHAQVAVRTTGLCGSDRASRAFRPNMSSLTSPLHSPLLP